CLRAGIVGGVPFSAAALGACRLVAAVDLPADGNFPAPLQIRPAGAAIQAQGGRRQAGMTFRPYPGLTIACAILFAILCGLGAWQLERLQWKLDLIETVNGHMAAAPVSFDRIAAMSPEEAQYRRVTLTGRFDHSK